MYSFEFRPKPQNEFKSEFYVQKYNMNKPEITIYTRVSTKAQQGMSHETQMLICRTALDSCSTKFTLIGMILDTGSGFQTDKVDPQTRLVHVIENAKPDSFIMVARPDRFCRNFEKFKHYLELCKTKNITILMCLESDQILWSSKPEDLTKMMTLIESAQTEAEVMSSRQKARHATLDHLKATVPELKNLYKCGQVPFGMKLKKVTYQSVDYNVLEPDPAEEELMKNVASKLIELGPEGALGYFNGTGQLRRGKPWILSQIKGASEKYLKNLKASGEPTPKPKKTEPKLKTENTPKTEPKSKTLKPKTLKPKILNPQELIPVQSQSLIDMDMTPTPVQSPAITIFDSCFF